MKKRNGKRSRLDSRIRRWMLCAHPAENEMIGDFSKMITWRQLAERMLRGEDFYEACRCTESAERELCFQMLAYLFRTDYGFWYDLWLAGKKNVDRKTLATVRAQVAAL